MAIDLPDVGGDRDSWGAKLNAVLSSLDGDTAAAIGTANAANAKSDNALTKATNAESTASQMLARATSAESSADAAAYSAQQAATVARGSADDAINAVLSDETSAARASLNATYATLRAALLGNQQECTSVARVDLPSTPSPPALIRPRDPRTRRIVIQNVGANPAKFEYLNNGFFGFAYDTFEGAYNIIVDPGEEYIDTYRGGWLWGISPLGTTVVVQVTLGADS